MSVPVSISYLTKDKYELGACTCKIEYRSPILIQTLFSSAVCKELIILMALGFSFLLSFFQKKWKRSWKMNERRG